MERENCKSTTRMLEWSMGILGITGPIIVPIATLAVVLYWCPEYTRIVDRESCSCSCWDTVFKGPYERGNNTRYKHFYFNATANTAKIWILTVIAIITIYECVKHLGKLMINKSIRYSMLFLFCSIVYSHIYSVWGYIMYYNDDFYSQWNHQTFFTLTELISTAMVVHLANTKNKVTSRKILCIASIAVLHIIAGGFDQFFVNVLAGEGKFHQIIRDVFLMIPDIFHVIIPIWLYRETKREKLSKKIRDLILAVVIVSILLVIWYKFL